MGFFVESNKINDPYAALSSERSSEAEINNFACALLENRFNTNESAPMRESVAALIMNYSLIFNQ